MKKHLFIYLFIYLFIGCSEKYNTPKEIRETVWKKIRDTSQANCFNSDRESSKVKFKGDLMIFYMMADEYETVNFAKKTEQGYHIRFKENEKYGNRGVSFNFKWINKSKGISYWECIDTKKNTVWKDFSFYAIDSLNYYKLPKPDCIDCFSKEKCETLSEKELEIFDGEWKYDCLSNQIALTGLKPISEFYMGFTFNDGEYAKIIATVVKDLKEDNNYLLKYNMLTGITRGNRSLDWFNFSKDSIIAEIHLENENRLEFSWKGFFNEKLKRRESINFVFDDIYRKPIILKRCNK